MIGIILYFFKKDSIKDLEYFHYKGMTNAWWGRHSPSALTLGHIHVYLNVLRNFINMCSLHDITMWQLKAGWESWTPELICSAVGNSLSICFLTRNVKRWVPVQHNFMELSATTDSLSELSMSVTVSHHSIYKTMFFLFHFIWINSGKILLLEQF